MIDSIEFENFRNLNNNYILNEKMNIIFGKNSSGKSNLLDGIKLSFSLITGEYFKISKSDFVNSDDSKVITIKVHLKEGSIASLISLKEDRTFECGFIVRIYKNKNDKYIKKITLLNGSNVDVDALRDDIHLPSIFEVPFIRVSDLYTEGLTVGINNFIESEEQYKNIASDFKSCVKQKLSNKVDEFKELCSKFNEYIDIEVSDPKFLDEKVFVVDGTSAHNVNIGSGYKSVANIFLNTLNENHNIIVIDELENHLHPQLIRILLRELRSIENTTIIATTHSPVVINEAYIDELIDISGAKVNRIKQCNKKKLETFMHPGRSELCLADNIILVEGYTEELLLKQYCSLKNKNWTIVNVAGVMFEPYVELASLLGKKIIVISDNDICLSKNKTKSNRFCNLDKLCKLKKIKLIEVDNTLESDLYKSGYLDDMKSLLRKNEKHKDYYVAKDRKKTEIAQRLIDSNVNYDNWHVIKEINEEFKNN
ncbi:MAG: ATP-dependent nuclease [Candidatus Coprovivens sp.]